MNSGHFKNTESGNYTFSVKIQTLIRDRQPMTSKLVNQFEHCLETEKSWSHSWLYVQEYVTLFASIEDWRGNERRSFSLLQNDLPGPGTSDVDTVFQCSSNYECTRQTYNLGSPKIEEQKRGHHSSCRGDVASFVFLTISVITSVFTLLLEVTLWGDFLEERLGVSFSKSIYLTDLLMTHTARLLEPEN